MRVYPITLRTLIGYLTIIATHSSSYVNSYRLLNETSEQLSCGQVATRQPVYSRIYNGFNVLPGEIPYQVRLSKYNKGSNHYCSGVIIAPHTILTTAHCVRMNYNKPTYAIAGNPNVNFDMEDSLVYEIEYSERHPNYRLDPVTKIPTNDIAILRTTERMTFNLTKNGIGSINSICLPSKQTKIRRYERLRVSGWGYLDEEEERAKVLQRAEVYVEDSSDCIQEYPDIDKDKIICAKGKIETPCYGDFGAPLVREEDGRYVLLGLYSYSRMTKETACPVVPAVYTNVKSYRRWLDLNV